MMNAGLGRCPCPAIVSGNQDDRCPGFSYPTGNRSDSILADQFDADAGIMIRIFQIIDQLRQILDGVNIVMRRRGDQSYTRRAVARLGNPRIDFFARQMSSFSRFGPLRHLDLDLLGTGQIFAGHPKTSAGDLFDRRILLSS